MIDSDRRPVSNQRPILKSASTDIIISNHSPLRLFSNHHPFKSLRSKADLLLSNRCPFQNKDMYVLLSCYIMDAAQVCTSALHIVSNECKMSKFQA